MKPIDPDVARPASGALHAYSAFGLTIGSDFELPELNPALGDRFDVRVIRARLPREIPDFDEGIVFDFNSDGLYFGWPLQGHFLLLADNTILYEAGPGAESTLGFALLGPVFSVVLHRLGRLMLHSSAVARDDRVVFFLGDKGAGKSTTAAAFVGAGFRLVTDDLLALDTEAVPAPTATPGFPQLKLARAAVPLLGATPQSELPSLNNKARMRLRQAFASTPHVVSAGYVLTRADEPGWRRLDPVAALSAAMRYSYITRFNRRLLDEQGLARHMRQCASLASRTPIYELGVPQDLTRLPDLVQEVAEHALA